MGLFRVVTYNIRSALMGSLEEIAQTLRPLDADVIALQEVDCGVKRSGGVDQARVLGEQLERYSHFTSARAHQEGRYGIALLTRERPTSLEEVELKSFGSFEPRVAIDAALRAGSGAVRLLAFHADFIPWVARASARTLARRVQTSLGTGVLVVGDLNATPRTRAAQVLRAAGLRDLVGERAEGVTYWPRPTARRVDYIWADAPLAAAAVAAQIGGSRASDHYPVQVDFEVQ